MVIYDMRSVQYALKRIGNQHKTKVRLNFELVKELLEDESQMAFVVSSNADENPVCNKLRELQIDVCNIEVAAIKQHDYETGSIIVPDNVSPHVNYFISQTNGKLTVVSGSYQIYPAIYDVMSRGVEVKVCFFPELMDIQWTGHDHPGIKFLKLNTNHLIGLEKLESRKFTYTN